MSRTYKDVPYHVYEQKAQSLGLETKRFGAIRPDVERLIRLSRRHNRHLNGFTKRSWNGETFGMIDERHDAYVNAKAGVERAYAYRSRARSHAYDAAPSDAVE